MAKSAAERFKENRTNLKKSMDRATKRTPFRDRENLKGMSYEQLTELGMSHALGKLRKTYAEPEFKELKDFHMKDLKKRKNRGDYDFRKRVKK
tara:strand:- start:346 stop:624 length:279 start_codon:yes stop_codon:yes gene_type:complete